jgi:hypothetical protein
MSDNILAFPGNKTSDSAHASYDAREEGGCRTSGRPYRKRGEKIGSASCFAAENRYCSQPSPIWFGTSASISTEPRGNWREFERGSRACKNTRTLSYDRSGTRTLS